MVKHRKRKKNIIKAKFILHFPTVKEMNTKNTLHFEYFETGMKIKLKEKTIEMRDETRIGKRFRRLRCAVSARASLRLTTSLILNFPDSRSN